MGIGLKERPRCPPSPPFTTTDFFSEGASEGSDKEFPMPPTHMTSFRRCLSSNGYRAICAIHTGGHTAFPLPGQTPLSLFPLPADCFRQKLHSSGEIPVLSPLDPHGVRTAENV